MKNGTDLSLASTKELLAELFGRYDGVLVVRERSPDGKSAITHFDYKGGASRCIGLAERAKVRLINLGEDSGEDAPFED